MIGIYACVDFMRLENITNPMLTDSQIGYLWIQNSGLEQQASQEPDQPFAWAGWGVDGIPVILFLEIMMDQACALLHMIMARLQHTRSKV